MKRAVIVLSAAVMMCSSPIGVYAEQMSAQEQTGYSTGTLSAPKVTKCKKYKNAVTLKWTKVKGATGYKVYKKVGSKYKTVGTVRSGSKVKFKIKKLKSGKKYSFKVRAYKKSGKKLTWSKYSAPKSVTTKADYSLFKPVVENFNNGVYPETPTRDPEVDTQLHQYFLYDLDGNGVKELVLRIGGYRADSYVYDYNCGSPKYVGMFSEFANGGGYGRIGRDIYTYTFHSGYLLVYKTSYKNKKLTTKTAYEGHDSEKGAYEKVKEYIDKMTLFTWYDLDDPSGLK